MFVVEAFREGGWFMYVVTGVGLLATLTALTAFAMALTAKIRQPSLAIGVAALVLGLLVPVTGFVGYLLAMQSVFGAVSYADPSSRATLLSQGISEAMNLVIFGLVCGAVPCLLALLATIRAALRPKTLA